MRSIGFDDVMPCYVATGLLTYAGGDETHNTVLDSLINEKLCSKVVYKEKYLTRDDLDQLHTEQKGLVDLLVILKAHKFVGVGTSTFSWFVREYRKIMGIPRDDSHLVSMTEVGTDALFAAAAVLS